MRAKKTLGQHFLLCHWVVSTMIKSAAVDASDTILEVGPGTGVLTRALAKTANRVIAIEKDEELAATLAESLKKDGAANAIILPGDILTALPTILSYYKLQTASYKLVANIPYYLTSRLIRILLEGEPKPERMVLTVQKEVAERIVAQPPKMNLLSLSIQIFGRPEVVKIVPAECFSPKPKIDSAIIKISQISTRFFEENSLNKERFFSLARAGFSQKRKTLGNSLAKVAEKKDVVRALAAAGLSPMARPEELSLAQWAHLAGELQN